MSRWFGRVSAAKKLITDSETEPVAEINCRVTVESVHLRTYEDIPTKRLVPFFARSLPSESRILLRAKSCVGCVSSILGEILCSKRRAPRYWQCLAHCVLAQSVEIRFRLVILVYVEIFELDPDLEN